MFFLSLFILQCKTALDQAATSYTHLFQRYVQPMMECCNTPMPDTSSGVAADANIEILDLQDFSFFYIYIAVFEEHVLKFD